ncbi:MAG: hypothetical protein ACJATA_000812 [Sphingobacteriales bacterium]|jgi:hypothetical protein
MVHHFRSKNYLDEPNKFEFFNNYASPLYLQLFGIIAIFILWALSQKLSLSWVIIPACLGIGLILPTVTHMKMKNQITKIIIDREFVCIYTAYDQYKSTAEYFEHFQIAGPTRKKDQITINYKNRIFEIKQEDFPDFEEIWMVMNAPKESPLA